jgi:hypothetical protein
VSGVLIQTTAGQVQVDVLEVTDADLSHLPDDPNDRLHVLSHAWAATSATRVTIRTADMPDLTVASRTRCPNRDEYADRSLRLVRAVPEGRQTELDDLHLVGELLAQALTTPSY